MLSKNHTNRFLLLKRVRKSIVWPRKFKRGIGSLFDPVLTLWFSGHIGSSRMEQSYCTSGFFRQRVNARNHSNYQPTPKRRSISSRMVIAKTHVAASASQCVWYVLFFLAAPFQAFQTFPGKAQLFSRFFVFVFVFVFIFFKNFLEFDLSTTYRFVFIEREGRRSIFGSTGVKQVKMLHFAGNGLKMFFM